jgi:Multicopper oxidase
MELDDSDECTSDRPLPKFKFEPGKRYRLRLINAGSISNIRFSIDNHKLTIIEVFGVNDYVIHYFHAEQKLDLRQMESP